MAVFLDVLLIFIIGVVDLQYRYAQGRWNKYAYKNQLKNGLQLLSAEACLSA